MVIQILTGLTNWHDFHTSMWSPKQSWASKWGRIRWRLFPRKLPMSPTDDRGTRWPDQLSRCIRKAISVREKSLYIRARLWFVFILSTFEKKTIVLSNKWFFTFKTPSEHKLAEKHNQPFQKTHVAVLSMISMNQNNTLKSQSSSSECTKPPKSGTSLLWLYERVEWIKITADKFQTQTICGHFIVFLKSCMETFTQLFYSYFTA